MHFLFISWRTHMSNDIRKAPWVLSTDDDLSSAIKAYSFMTLDKLFHLWNVCLYIWFPNPMPISHPLQHYLLLTESPLHASQLSLGLSKFLETLDCSTAPFCVLGKFGEAVWDRVWPKIAPILTKTRNRLWRCCLPGLQTRKSPSQLPLIYLDISHSTLSKEARALGVGCGGNCKWSHFRHQTAIKKSGYISIDFHLKYCQTLWAG